MTVSDEHLNNRLRAWRAEVGISLQEAADLTGMSMAMLSRVERGQRNLAPLAKAKIARRLGVRITDLFEVEPFEPAEDEEAEE